MSTEPSGLIVLGMHRSGTSAVTGTLRLCGAWVGEEAELTGAGFENPRGFWERRDTRNVCDRLLHSAGADWWKIARFEPEAIPHAILAEERKKFTRIVSSLNEHRSWALKEPRLCLLLSVLRDCVSNPICIHVFRNPLEVARSLQTRNGFGIAAGLALWEAYNCRALSASEHLPRVLIPYDSLVLRPQETIGGLLERLAEFAATDLVMPNEDRLSEFIDPTLYRRRADEDETREFLSPSQLALWQQCCSGKVLDHKGSTSLPHAARQHLLDLESTEHSLRYRAERVRGLTEEVSAQHRTVADLRLQAAEVTLRLEEERATIEAHEKTVAEHEKTIAEHKATIQARDTAIRNLLRSTSWRVTVPLRILSRVIRWSFKPIQRLSLIAKPHSPRLPALDTTPSSAGPSNPGTPSSTPQAKPAPASSTPQAKPAPASSTPAPNSCSHPRTAPRSQQRSPTARDSFMAAETAFVNDDLAQTLVHLRNIPVQLQPHHTLHARTRYLYSLTRRLTALDEYKAQIAWYSANRAPDGPNRMVIYTAIVNNCDSLKLPEILNPAFDYVLFSDNLIPDTGIWQVRPITFAHFDPVRSARFVKTHPHILLHDYDIAVWVDSNILLHADIAPFIERLRLSGHAIGAIPHSTRESVYEEGEACIRLDKDNEDAITAQLDKYRNEDFHHSDLIESGFLIFDMTNSKIPKFLDYWWREIDSHSRRDQLSLNYALSKAGLDWHPLINWPSNIRHHNDFSLVPHDRGTGPGATFLEGFQAPMVDPYAGQPYSEVKARRIARQRERPIDIVICVHDALSDVEQCIHSVLQTRDQDRHKLILVDDGSAAPTTAFLESTVESARNCELYRNDHALGYTKAANRGLGVSRGDLVVLLNSDTVATKDWVHKLADAVFSTPGAGIVGPLSNAASHQSIPDPRNLGGQTAINLLPDGLTAEGLNMYCEEWTVADKLPLVPLIHGFCFGITRTAIDKVGLFDEQRYPRGYGEENDYCFRAANAGIMMVVATHTFIYHAKTRSYSNDLRQALSRESSHTLKDTYGEERVRRAVNSMSHHLMLKKLREFSSTLISE